MKIDPHKHIFNSKQFDSHFLEKVFNKVDEIKNNPQKFREICKEKISALLFYEPSTRTRMSFESAMLRLGGNCITTENATESSSTSKGESLEDTIKIVSSYADFIILRHSEDDLSNLSKLSKVPIINAGSGKEHHPTQALLDLYTIKSYFPNLSNLKIAVAGDLLRGRACNSFISSMSRFANNKFFLISPLNSKINKDLRKDLEDRGVSFVETEDINSVLSEVDVCYITRIQKERFSSNDEYLKAKGKIILNKDNISLMKKDSIVLHPLPRVDEISQEIDDDKRVKYFEQVKNGVYVRMALFCILKS